MVSANKSATRTMHDVLHIPAMNVNLFSMRAQQLMASLLSSVREDVVKKSTGFEALYHWTIIRDHFLLIIPASQYCNTQSNYFSNDKNPMNGSLAVNFLLFEQRKKVCEKYKCQAEQKLHHNHQTFTNKRT